MNGSRSVFKSSRNFSTLAIAFGIVISSALGLLIDSGNLGWQIILAVIALSIGIPHGAVDHLVAMPRTSNLKFAALIIGYVLVAVISVLAILHWNILGFQLVLIMSVLHFGFGDVAFIAEKDRLDNKARMSSKLLNMLAITSGAVPVLIPLLKSSTARALESINPELVAWAEDFAPQLKFLIFFFLAATIILLVKESRHRELIDLIFLTGLALVAPPLIAFAFYFGCWHAIRHTARLTLLLPKSISAAKENRPIKSFASAVIPGLPALLGTILVALIFSIKDSSNLDGSYLWYLLVVVWALTVPHMMVTARIDQKALA